MSKRVLIVDDDQAIRSMLVVLFSDEGYDVDEASNGREALRCLDQRQTDLVLLDLRMPVMDGWRFLEESGVMPQFAALPIVVFSASHNKPNDRRIRAFFNKPFELEAVADAVKNTPSSDPADDD